MKIGFLLLVFLCSMNFAEAGALKRYLGLEYNYTESVVLDSSIQGELKKQWKLANAAATGEGESIVEWVPKDQNLKNRNELLTFKFTAHSCSRIKAKSALEFSTFFYNQLLNKYSEMRWNTLAQTENDMLFEWILPGSHQKQSHHEIIRIIWTEKGIHFTSYEKRGPDLDPTIRALWVERIRNAKLKY